MKNPHDKTTENQRMINRLSLTILILATTSFVIQIIGLGIQLKWW